MKPNVIRAGLLALSIFLAPAPAAADGIQDAIVAQLADQGFTHVRVSKTFLGRVRLYATSPDYTREIILNPRTGEILRDYWVAVDERGGGHDDDGGGHIVSPGGSSGSGSGSGGDDDYTDDGHESDGDGDEPEDDEPDEEDEPEEPEEPEDEPEEPEDSGDDGGGDDEGDDD